MTTASSATETSVQLPIGYTMRPPAFDDLATVVALLAACDSLDYGEAEETESTIGDHWRPMSLTHDARIVVDSAGSIVGYADQAKRNPVRLPGYACVHPDHRERGIGSALTGWVEARAALRIQDAPEGARVRLQFGVARENQAAIDLLNDRGYAFARGFQRMLIELDSQPPVPVWPAGVDVRQYVKGPDDESTWQAVEEAFEDH